MRNTMNCALFAIAHRLARALPELSPPTSAPSLPLPRGRTVVGCVAFGRRAAGVSPRSAGRTPYRSGRYALMTSYTTKAQAQSLRALPAFDLRAPSPVVWGRVRQGTVRRHAKSFGVIALVVAGGPTVWWWLVLGYRAIGGAS